MPKQRSSGSLAAGASNSGTNGSREMAGRAANRISSSGALGSTLSMLSTLASRRNSTSIDNEEFQLQEAENVLEQLDLHMEEERRNLINEEDDGFFYTEETDDQEFSDILHELGSSEIPYEYENVLNGSSVTFGIELEFVGGDADRIAKELYDLGICAYDHRVRYHAPGVPGKWKLERDSSVSSGSQGGELVSPVLTDTPETWRAIEKICEVAKRHGARINHQCGGHVHIGIEPLNTARQRWKRFFKSIGGFEDVIYRLSGGSLGRIRSNYSTYARPFSERAQITANSRIRLNDRNDIDNLTRRASQSSRYYGINLTNIYQANKPKTVEFRYFNGSLDPSVIQANIKVSNGVIMASQKARTRNTRSEPTTETFKKRGQLLRDHTYEQDRSNNTIKKFVDIMFTRKKDKDTILGLFARNSWA